MPQATMKVESSSIGEFYEGEATRWFCPLFYGVSFALHSAPEHARRYQMPLTHGSSLVEPMISFALLRKLGGRAIAFLTNFMVG
jgi:hypothetical protein